MGENEMKKLIIELSDERLITPSGLSLVGQLLGKTVYVGSSWKDVNYTDFEGNIPSNVAGSEQ